MNGDLAPRPEGGDPARLRISDDDRHKVAEILREAAGEGRLDLDELDERIEATYAAKTYADLIPITADLPAHGPAPDVPVARSSRQVAPPGSSHQSSSAILGECVRRGAWTVPAEHTAFSFMGTVTLDLREATFEGTETRINANTVMGEVKVIVDAFTQVVVDGTPILGEFSQAKDKVPAEIGARSPTVRIAGFALLGSVTVVRQPDPGTPKAIFGTY